MSSQQSVALANLIAMNQHQAIRGIPPLSNSRKRWGQTGLDPNAWRLGQYGGGVKMNAILIFNLLMLILSIAILGFFIWYAKQPTADTSELVKTIGNFSSNSIYGIYIFGPLTVLSALLALIT